MSKDDIPTSPENYKKDDISVLRKLKVFSECGYMYGAYGLSQFLHYRSKRTFRPLQAPNRIFQVFAEMLYSIPKEAL